MMIRVSNHLLSTVFGFHYHSQKVIGSLGKYHEISFKTFVAGRTPTKTRSFRHQSTASAAPWSSRCDDTNPTAKSSRNYCTVPVEVGSLSHYLQVLLHPRWFTSQLLYCWWFRNPAFTSWGTGSWNSMIYDGFFFTPSKRWLVGNGISAPSTVGWHYILGGRFLLPSLKLIAKALWKQTIPKGKVHFPSPVFQLGCVSFREGIWLDITCATDRECF